MFNIAINSCCYCSLYAANKCDNDGKVLIKLHGFFFEFQFSCWFCLDLRNEKKNFFSTPECCKLFRFLLDFSGVEVLMKLLCSLNFIVMALFINYVITFDF